MSADQLSLDLRYLDGDMLRTANGKEFYYEHRGQDGPDLTIVNNFFLVAPIWRNFTERLVLRNRILTYDLRNQGASTHDPEEDMVWRDHVDDLEAVLDGLGIERTCLLGTSISALICRDFAIAHPSRVSGLILVGPACTTFGGGARWRAVTRAWANSLRTGGPEALWDHLYSMVFGEATMDRLGAAGYLGLREAFAALHSADAAQANLRSSLMASADPALLRDIKCPTLLLVGEEDFLWSPTALQRVGQFIGDLTTICLPEVGHLPFLDDTNVFESAVQSFLDRIGQREKGGGPLPRLRQLLGEVLGDRAELPDTGLDQRPLAELGLDSWAFVRLLASIEREFGIEWDVDVPMSALRNLEAIAAMIDRVPGKGRR